MHRSWLRWFAVTWLLAIAVPAAIPAQAGCPRGALPAYAHNDYRNARPLADALSLGFRGVEADVFLIDGVLRVGHDRRAARAGGTLEALYLAPLQALVERCRRLTADDRPFLLAVELKEASAPAYDTLVVLLGRHRPLLAAASGAAPALALVLVGWHPSAPPDRARASDTLLGVQRRLRRPEGGSHHALDPRVRLLSLDYGKTMGRWWVTAAGRRRWLAALRTAKAAAPGRLLRVHNVPIDRGLYVALLDAGVDLIGTKHIARTQQLLDAPAGP